MFFRTLIWRPLHAEALRTLLSLFAIALGVAVVVAIRVANRGAVASFQRTTRALAGTADLLATGPDPLPATLLPRLNFLGASATVTPYLDRRAFDPHADDTLEVLGLDFVATAGAGTLSSSAPSSSPLPGIVLSGAYAQAHHYRAGDPLTLAIGGVARHFRVAAVLPDQGAARAQPGDLALLDLPDALAAFEPAQPPAFDGLRITLAPGVAPDTVIRQLRPLLPAADTVAPPAARDRQDAKMLAAFRANLEALSYVSLLIGVFLIYNTVSISVVRRRSAIATLRAFGVLRGQILRLFLFEGLALALIGGLLGLLLGWLFAAGALELVSRTVNSLYAASQPGPATLQWSDAVWALTLALVSGAAAAFVPAYEAASLAPAVALRPGAEESALRRHPGRLLLAAAAFASSALLLPRLPEPNQMPVWGFASALAAVLAWACLVPPALAWLLPRARRFFLRRGLIASGLAAGGLAGALRRSAVLACALAIAIGVLFGVAIMVGSFRQTVEVWIGQQLQADVFVRAADWTRETPVPLPSATVAWVDATPGVAAVQASHSQMWTYNGQPVFLNTRWRIAGSSGAAVSGPQYRFLSGLSPQAVLAQIDAGAVIVSEPFARRFHLGRGDRVRLQTPAGILDLPIAGVFYDYTSDRGLMVLPYAWFSRFFGPPAITELGLYAAPGLGSAALRRRVGLRLVDRPEILDVHDNASLRAEAMRVFDQTFRITYALEAITLLVAVLGIANTLLAVVLERGREFAILRFLGSTRAQTRRLLLAEAGLLGAMALLIGAGIGGVLALILVRVINVQSFGWTIQFHLPYAFLLPAAALIWLVTLAAGWFPARAAWRQDPLRAVAAE